MTSLASHTSLAPLADRTGHSRDLGFSPDRLARISGWMRRYVEAGKLPYVSVLVARQGAIAFLDACGSGAPDNRATPPPAAHTARPPQMTQPTPTLAAPPLLDQDRPPPPPP